jgi:GntR family transcriptional repressor for pyruvate dehydrogenase complex
MPVYLPIKPKERLYQEIVDQIQQQILSGALKPGDQIPAERDLAERFGVSRTAVREAIKSLTEKGLIEVFVGRGTFVTSLSPDRVVESMTLLLRNEPHGVASLQEARALLEGPTARWAPSVAAKHTLRACAPQAELEEEHSMSPRLVDGDTEFHVELAAPREPRPRAADADDHGLLRTQRLYRDDMDFDAALRPRSLSHREIIDASATATVSAPSTP